MTALDPNAKRAMTLHLHREEDLSILVSTDGVVAHAKFLPRSKIEIAPERVGARVMVSLPNWLIEEKGLLPKAGDGQGSLF